MLWFEPFKRSCEHKDWCCNCGAPVSLGKVPSRPFPLLGEQKERAQRDPALPTGTRGSESQAVQGPGQPR